MDKWSCEQICQWVNGLPVPLSAYSIQFRHHNISGTVLPYLTTLDLLEMGVESLRDRLMIKNEIEKAVGKSSEELDQNSLVQQESLKTACFLVERVSERMSGGSETRKVQEQFTKLREDLLPVFKWIKETKPLPTPENTKFLSSYNNLSLSSPTKSPVESGGVSPGTASGTLTGAHLGNLPGSLSRKNSKRKSIYSSPKNNVYPLASPTAYAARSVSSSNVATIQNPPLLKSQHSTPSLSTSQNEPLKQLRAKTDDPCHKILQAAMRRHNLNNDDWRKYALVICYGDQERVLGMEEKPVVVFRELQEMGQHPAIMLRQLEENSDEDDYFSRLARETPGGRL